MSRAEKIKFGTYDYDKFPVTFWDLFGEQGHPVRTTVSEMGPLLLSRLMELSDAQEGVMNIAFNVADEQGLALLDLKDLRAMLIWLGENSDEVSLHAAMWVKTLLCDPTAFAGAGKSGRGFLFWRACA